jgi:hypothetical protein
MYAWRGGNNRLVRFSEDGRFIKAWGRRASDGTATSRCSSTIRVGSRSMQRADFTSPIAETNEFKFWTESATLSPVRPDSASRAGSLSVGQAISMADGMADDRWNPRLAAPHPDRRLEDRLDQGLYLRPRGFMRRRPRISGRRHEGRIFWRKRSTRAGHVHELFRALFLV